MSATLIRPPAIGALSLTLLAGCVALKPAPRSPSSQALVTEGVPLTEFGAQTCGAATLAAVLTYWDHPITIDDLDSTLPKADNGGVLSLDMALAARQRGFAAELAVGDRELVRQSLEKGHPLILMLQIVDNLGRSRDLFHYVIVDGFDPHKDLVRVQYGDGRARWVSFERLSGAWGKTGFATLLIGPEGGSQVAGDSILYAVALEEAGQLTEAEAIYRHLLQSDSRSPLLWVNLGNVLNGLDRPGQAEEAYREALNLDPMQVEALNNLAWLLLQSGGDLGEAQELVARAVALGGPDPYLALDTMGRIQLEMQRCSDAIGTFELARRKAPAGSTARGWILHGLALAQRDCGDTERAIQILESVLQHSDDEDLNAAISVELQALRPQ